MWEYRKLLQKPVTCALLLLIFCLNALLVAKQDAPGTQRHTNAVELQAVYASLEDKTPLEAAATLESVRDKLREAIWDASYDAPLLTQDVYIEKTLIDSVLERVQETASYPEYNSGVLAVAEQMLQLPAYGDTDSFVNRNLRFSAALYSCLSAVQPVLCYTGAAEPLPGGRMTDAFALLLALLLGLELFVNERPYLPLLLPTKHGRFRLAASKLLSGLLGIALGCALLYGTNLLIGVLRCGATPLHIPIQSIFGFQQSPWRITVGEYYLLFFVSKTLWCMAIGAVLFFSCVLCRQTVSSCMCALLLLAPSLALLFSNRLLCKSLSLLHFGDTVGVFRSLVNGNVFGYPVPEAAVSCAVVVLTLCFFSGGSIFLWCRRVPIYSVKKNRKNKARHGLRAPVFAGEL